MYHSRSCHSQVMCCCFRSAPDAFGGRPVAPLFPGALLFPLPAAAAAPAAAGPLIHVHCRGLLRRRLRRTCLCSRSTRVGQQSTSNRRSLTGFSSASVLCCRCCTTQAVEQKEAPASSRGGLHVGNCASSRARGFDTSASRAASSKSSSSTLMRASSCPIRSSVSLKQRHCISGFEPNCVESNDNLSRLQPRSAPLP